jgi:hypothetical protein
MKATPASASTVPSDRTQSKVGSGPNISGARAWQRRRCTDGLRRLSRYRVDAGRTRGNPSTSGRSGSLPHQYVVDMLVDGPFTDSEALADLAVGEALADQLRDVLLAWRERAGAAGPGKTGDGHRSGRTARVDGVRVGDRRLWLALQPALGRIGCFVHPASSALT